MWVWWLTISLISASDIPKTFHNYPQTPYDTRQQSYDPTLQNVPPASISYVPVQADPQQPQLQQPIQPIQPIQPRTPAPNRGPQPNGHMLALQQQGVQTPPYPQAPESYSQPPAADYTSQQFPAALPPTQQNVASLTQVGQTNPQGMISSGAAYVTSAEMEQQLELQRQQQAKADAERARAALEAQREKIEAKQRQLEAERRKQEEEREAYIRRQQEEQQRQYQQQVSYPHQPNPNVPSDQHAALSQLSNQQLEEYAQRLREQISREQSKQPASAMVPQTLPVQMTMATTAAPVTQALVVAEQTTVVPVVEGFGQPTDQSQPQPLPPPPYPGVPQIPPKPTHEINYCDRGQFDDKQLADLHLKRADYFIYNTSCSGLFFQCAIGQTFVLRCPSEQAQAFDPAISSCNFKNSVRFCPEYDHVLHCTIRETCTDDQFACCALPQKRIEYTRRCDGHRDCSDGEDENNCPSCAKDEFACVKSGICIPAKKRCDGKPDDCGDGTNMDEIGCSKNETCWGKFVCDSADTTLQVGHSVCLDYEKHCDGVKDCPGGEDEVNCKLNDAKYLSCENQKQQVRKEQWCDGREDCADGSDEKYCF